MNYQVEYSLAWKANLGNYEMLDTRIGVTVNGAEGDSPKETLEKARAFVERELEVAVKRSRLIIEGK